SLMNLVGDLLINRHRLNRKLQQVTSLRGELVRARERLLHVVGDFNGRYEFSQRRQTAAKIPSDGFSELELDRYDDFNILSRSLVEIAADAEEIVTQIDGQFGSFSEETLQFTTVTRRLQEEVARTRMVPLDALFRRLKRAVHDASVSEGKAVSLVVEGADNRIDKFINDQLFRPLLHIVRNAVAHGIESGAVRLAAGKAAAGQVSVRSRTEAGRLALEIADDGGGLPRAEIIRVARSRGLLAADATPDDVQLAELIFQPGFSTAATVNDVSGRGVGLDVVRQEVTNLGGTVSVQNRPGHGTTFVLTLPVTLAINQVMFVQCGERTYALPLNFVERIVPAPAASFSRSGHSEMLMLEGRQTVPVVRLHSRLGLPGTTQAATAIILTVADRRTALIVDRIQSKIDIVVKPLGALLNRHPFFSGATLAGDGRVIFILDVPRLLSSGATRTPAPSVEIPADASETLSGDDRRRILVVDDSLSIRRIAASYLTQAGFEVETAVDGSEALEKLRAGGYALVVSDLEMPRVNGFELISEMHRHPDLAEIPVIILTSRDAAKHRDRARELRAADYLIKPVSREQLTSAVSAQLEKSAVLIS
ncbi:MAG: response regulator, partial [Verrucomicrobia bacterium]|nr:response regulator [Verrucomicrobiota bacterium]